jgi:outer membrane receptor protein involved in Fe transport
MTHARQTSSLSALAAAMLVSALAPSVAAAQDSVSGNGAEAEPEEAQIVVTGSRIATDATTSSAGPVQVLTAEQLKRTGEIDITQTLRELPALQGSDPANLDTAQGLALSGASTLNLRSLGSNRTLVLQDGRRHVPGIAGTATVDVGSIPQALIREVQVLTGGASGVYGADAVSGVVNYITRSGRDFDGLEYRVQTGISDEGDSEEIFASVAGGGSFQDGRGSAVFAVEYSKNAGILAGDRDFAAGPGYSIFGQSNDFLNEQLGLAPGTENAFIPDRRLPVSSSAGIIAIGGFPFDRLAFGPRVATNFLPGTSTVPTFPGTNIPILQIIDPQTGELRAYNPGISTSAFNASGGDGIFTGNAPGLTLIPEQTRVVAAGGVDYQITDTLTFFADAKLAYVETSNIDGIPFADDLFLAGDNPFLPTTIQDQLVETGRSFVGVALDNLASDTGRGTDIERTTIRASGGLRWEAPESNVNFEASYSWGRTEVNDTNRRTRLNDRYFTAFDAVALTQDNIDGTDPVFNFTSGSGTLKAVRNGQDIEITSGTAQIGDIVCRAEVTGLPSPSNAPFLVGGPPIYNDGVVINGTDVSGLTRPVTFQIGDGSCAPLNLLGDFASQGAALDFAFVDINQKTVIEQQQFLAVLAGDTEHLFELPAGPIGFAAGFEWRRDTSQFTRDSFESIEARVVENNAAPLFNSPLNGEGISVWELFGEIRVPILADMPFVHNLEVTAAGRYSDYNTIGSTETYSFGAIYAPTDWLSFRGTLSRAIRAPNIGELFAPQSIATIGVDADPCDDGNINNGSSNRPANCAQFVAPGFDSSQFLTAFSTGTTGGNPLLSEETSDSYTIGAIFQPRGILGGALDNLVVLVDYYDIEITDAVGSLSGAAIAAACVDLPSIQNQFCDAIERDPNRGGAIVGFTSGNINLQVLRARGIDFETRYSFDAPFGDGDYGRFTLSAAGTHFLERFTEGDPVIQQTIADEPDPLQQQLLIADQATVSNLLGVVGVPDWIVNFGINWELDKWNIGWRTRWEDSTLQVSNAAATDVEIVGGEVVVSPNVGILDRSQLFTGDGFEHDITVSYDVSDKIQVYGGVNNLTDTEPFLGNLTRPVSPRGRFFFLGLSGSF